MANDATTDTPMSDGVRHSTTNPPAATTNIATRSTIDGSSSAVRINNREKNGSAKEKGTIPALNNGEKARNALPSGDPLTASDDATTPPNRPNVAVRFYRTFKSILLSSWINVLLVFVPIGIASECASLSPSIIFSMNAVAIIPLAGMLSYATESVARRMGDTVGALMNVTFGNAVELIIFIIALVKNEIRIVQASLLGSILANLLLILGMCFFIGGLRFREQIYNSTVTQMSACLLSLSVMSLLLPTAFHASFTDTALADAAVVKVSRGTSVILLLVYVLYLLFQLKSHAYLYESPPQHEIDEASVPGPAAGWMDSSSSSDEVSSESDSSDSNTTASRIKRVMRRHRKHKERDIAEGDENVEAAMEGMRAGPSTISTNPAENEGNLVPGMIGHRFGAIDGDKDTEKRDADAGGEADMEEPPQVEKKKKRHHRLHRHRHSDDTNAQAPKPLSSTRRTGTSNSTTRHVDFAAGTNAGTNPAPTTDLEAQRTTQTPPRRPLNRLLPSVFDTRVPDGGSPSPSPAQDGRIPRVRYGVRRTNSLPAHLLSGGNAAPLRRTSSPFVPHPLSLAPTPVDARIAANGEAEEEEENISRTTAIVLLLVSTGLVAVCAEFMVGSINDITSNPGSGVSATFIGLIVLPIVGNAAEHVTAVTVAMKNKMDLAIGVAVGSSIQIALFVTPLVVLLGWCMSKDMTLYFTLFETVSLFVSAFIVNFLVLDGRTNYLEGALLCAAYVIIAVAAFFYPSTAEASVVG